MPIVLASSALPSRQDNEPLGEFAFITPKVELLDPREAVIPVQPEDQKVLQEANIIAAAGRTEAASAWKQHHWGTPRDERLIARLMALPRLSRLAQKPPKDPNSVSPHRKRHWFKGQGFQPATGSTESPDPVFWDTDDWFIPADVAVDDLILLEAYCKKIGNAIQVWASSKTQSTALQISPASHQPSMYKVSLF